MATFKVTLDPNNVSNFYTGGKTLGCKIEYLLNNNTIEREIKEAVNRKIVDEFIKKCFRAEDEKEFIRIRITRYTGNKLQYVKSVKEYEVEYEACDNKRK